MIEFILHVVSLDVYQRYFKHQDGLPDPTTMSLSTALHRRVR